VSVGPSQSEIAPPPTPYGGYRARLLPFRACVPRIRAFILWLVCFVCLFSRGFYKAYSVSGAVPVS
jgi:hypothetical protein